MKMAHELCAITAAIHVRFSLEILNFTIQVGANTLLMLVSTDPRLDPARTVDDLVWLAREAAERSVQLADQPNLRMVIDAFLIFALGRDADDIDGTPSERILLFQLSDLDHPVRAGAMSNTARRQRLLPGGAASRSTAPLRWLAAGSYTGPIGLEVFNDALIARAPATIAREAIPALRAVCAAAGID
jgi:4-hydroxyphenylpyruvate dioxygenase